MKKLLTKEQQIRVNKIEDEIKENGFAGDQLSYPFFREKRVDDKRVYFLVYEDLNAALMVSISDKRMQQPTIDKIKEYFEEYKKAVERLI